MVLKRMRVTVFAAALFAAGTALTDRQAAAQPPMIPQLTGGNYSVQGVPFGDSARLYPSPRPTPPLVGRTSITYQPLAPHEFLYEHHRVYRTSHGAAGTTRTSVRWNHRPSAPPVISHLMPTP